MCMMANTQNIIDKLKSEHEKEMRMYSSDINKYMNEYGEDKSDYLICRMQMLNYHRGAYNVLIRLEKELFL